MSEVTQQVGISFSALKSLLPRPQIITGFFKDYLIRHFQDGLVQNPELQNLIWLNSERTNILIEASTRWTPEMAHRRPAIIIHGNDSENMRIGIADKLQGGDDKESLHFETLWVSSTTLFCIGETGAQAAVLANEVKNQISGYQERIRETLELQRFRVLKVGAIGELAEYSQNYVCPVTVGYFYSDSWTVTIEAPRLSKISLSLSNIIEI